MDTLFILPARKNKRPSSGRVKRIEQLTERKKKYRGMLAESQITSSEYESDIKEISEELSLIENPKCNMRDWKKVAEDIADLTGEIDKTLSGDSVKDKRAMLTKLGSNLIWDEKILNIINTEPIQKLIDGLNEAKKKNPKFEPKNIVDTSTQNSVFMDAYPILLAYLSWGPVCSLPSKVIFNTFIISQRRNLSDFKK